MRITEKPANEQQRIETVKKYDILDTPPDGNFDNITTLAAAIFKVPIAIISIVDADRIWFKSHYGLEVNQINRDPGLCASAILSNDPYIIENALHDPRSLANPLVASDFGLHFYAAVPLQAENNCNLGTLCLLDKSPRKFTEEEIQILKQLAQVVMNEMNMRLELRDTVHAVKTLTSDITNHLKNSIKNIESTDNLELKEEILTYLDDSKLFMQNVQNRLAQI
jgi:GAF domain-containing protein